MGLLFADGGLSPTDFSSVQGPVLDSGTLPFMCSSIAIHLHLGATTHRIWQIEPPTWDPIRVKGA